MKKTNVSGKTHCYRSHFYVDLEHLEIFLLTYLPACLLQLSPPETLNLFQCPKPLTLDNIETPKTIKLYFLAQGTVMGQ